MANFTEQQKKMITDRMIQRGVVLPCPRCGSTKPFFVVNGYSKGVVHPKLSGPVIVATAESYIPAIVTSCPQCGFISEHSTNILGLKEDFVDGKKAGGKSK